MEKKGFSCNLVTSLFGVCVCVCVNSENYIYDSKLRFKIDFDKSVLKNLDGKYKMFH